MTDLEIVLEHRPGALAEMGEALGRAGVSVEGGGAFLVSGRGIAHFLVADAVAARQALANAGIRVMRERAVVAVRLRQEEPGQLGSIARRMAHAGVNIEAVYSDHGGNLMLAVDDEARAGQVARTWSAEAEGAA